MDERGKQKRKNVAASVILVVIGLLCIAYCIGIGFFGYGTLFFLIWGVMGAACILLGSLIGSERMMNVIPRWLKRIVAVLICAGFLVFLAVEGMILSQYGSTAEPGADYCIVLGAQWKSTGPSEVLRRRLDRAVEYLNASAGTKVIVSGGQGGNEPIAEAEGMKKYLMDAGIAEDRILVEALSENTYENLVFSGRLIDRENARVVIVTNNFHVFRAVKIAEKQGYSHVQGIAASAVKGMAPNNLLREFIGVLKDFVMGNL